ncbi:MAG: N(4)-(beta-N-acetylglucosaminyl)-L-asparaginase [Phycisphaerales bacterium]|nr:N(4)-(beta-N-acetylglucosaminyl)-L-asparaginase [Phycisphaerales bacterium]
MSTPESPMESPENAARCPFLLSTWSFGQRANEAAWPALAAGGSSIDAVEAVSVFCEDDPEIDSVGYGGLPDRDGAMSLDGCVMLSPEQCGSVCAIRRHRHPVSIARQVMDHTPHIMLAGEGADAFADAHDHPVEELLSPGAREAWEKRQRELPEQSRASSPRPVDVDPRGQLFAHGDDESRWSNNHDTIGVLAIDERGTLAGACSTSGMPWKVPGRVGDSPIIGHGLYVDPEGGAAVATGTGELVMAICGSFLAVELMRGGAMPGDAIREVLERIAKRSDLEPGHQIAVIALRPDGHWGSGALRPGFRLATSDAGGHQLLKPELVLLPGT